MNRHIILSLLLLVACCAFSSAGEAVDEQKLEEEINKHHLDYKPNHQVHQEHVNHKSGHKTGHKTGHHNHHRHHHKKIKSSMKRPLKSSDPFDIRRVRVVNLPDNWDRNPALFQTYK